MMTDSIEGAKLASMRIELLEYLKTQIEVK